MATPQLRTALVYDWLDTQQGGVERILESFQELLPNATWCTATANPRASKLAQTHEVKTSFLQHLPPFLRAQRPLLLPFYPLAFESLDFSGFDLVISITSAFAKGIITRPDARHICYLLTPPRYIYDQSSFYLSPLERIFAQPVFGSLRLHDFVQAKRPDEIYSISKHVQNRARTYYRRESTVVYPPFDDIYWSDAKKRAQKMANVPEPYFLIVNRLEPYKNTQLALEACRQAQVNAVVVGRGTQKKHLQKKYPTVTWIESATDLELAGLYKGAEALIMAQEEDFGMVSLEAQFMGCPVITYARSGAAETIIEGKTGITFATQSLDCLSRTIASHGEVAYNKKQSTQHLGASHVSRQFGKKRFMQTFSRICGISLQHSY
jgi:glycosyltransferase involved in cell wall biosynthesis